MLSVCQAGAVKLCLHLSQLHSFVSYRGTAMSQCTLLSHEDLVLGPTGVSDRGPKGALSHIRDSSQLRCTAPSTPVLQEIKYPSNDTCSFSQSARDLLLSNGDLCCMSHHCGFKDFDPVLTSFVGMIYSCLPLSHNHSPWLLCTLTRISLLHIFLEIVIVTDCWP